MANTTTLTLRLDPEIKKSAEALFSDFGMSIPDAVSLFLHMALLVRGIPFEVKRPTDDIDAETRLEVERLAYDPSAKRYKSFSEVLDAVHAEDADDV